ncbi:MAG: DUF1559 domain-containing protein [Planctomycetota bacterium]
MKRKAFTLVELLVVIAIIGILVAMLLPGVQMVREAARRTSCMNKLRQIGLATLSFEGVHEAYPPARLFPKLNAIAPYDRGTNQPSWLVRILPFVEQQPFYEQWDLSKPYDEHDNEVISRALELYFCPSRRTLDTAKAPDVNQSVAVSAPCGCGGIFQITVIGGATGDYAGNHGDLSPGSVGADTDYYFGGNGTGVIISSQAITQSNSLTPRLDWIDRITHGAISDGTSNTVLAGELHVTAENLNVIPFNGPIFNGEDLAAFSRIGGPGVPILGPKEESPTGVLGFGSWHPQVCNFVYADGSTHSVQTTIDTVTLGKLCNRADNQPF